MAIKKSNPFILILNGSSCAGKSSILSEFKNIYYSNSKDLFPEEQALIITFGIDAWWLLLPQIKMGLSAEADYFVFHENRGENGLSLSTEITSKGVELQRTFIEMKKHFYNKGYSVLADDVILSPKIMRCYVETLKNTRTYFIGATCDLSVLKEREKRRLIEKGDRNEGLPSDQYEKSHFFRDYYDLVIDTTNITIESAALHLYEYVMKNENPRGLLRLSEDFNRLDSYSIDRKEGDSNPRWC